MFFVKVYFCFFICYKRAPGIFFIFIFSFRFLSILGVSGLVALLCPFFFLFSLHVKIMGGRVFGRLWSAGWLVGGEGRVGFLLYFCFVLVVLF